MANDHVPIDALVFLRTHTNWRFPIFIHHPLVRVLAWRAVGFLAWRRGDLSLGEALQNMVVAPVKTPQVMEKTWRSVALSLSEELREVNDHFMLFGNKFFLAADPERGDALISTLKVINETIQSDQYGAGYYLKHDSVVIDAGANIGAFSVYAASRCPQGSVYAFEPATNTIAVLRKNISPYANIILSPCALGEKEKEVNLVHNATTPAAYALEDSGMPFGTYGTTTTEKVKVVTIDSLNLSRLDFLKSDAEGYEANIIRGGAETIRRCRPVIAFEIHHPGQDEVEIPKLIATITPGYRMERRAGTENVALLLPC